MDKMQLAHQSYSLAKQVREVVTASENELEAQKFIADRGGQTSKEFLLKLADWLDMLPTEVSHMP